MAGIAEVVARLDRGVARAETWVLGVLVAAMTATTFLQVVCRYVFNSPLVWSEELARFVFVWIALIGAGAAVRTGGHYGLDLVYRKLPAPARHWVGGLLSLGVALFAATLFVHGMRETVQAASQTASSLPIRMHWPFGAIPVGAALMLWHAGAHAVTAGVGAHLLERS